MSEQRKEEEVENKEQFNNKNEENEKDKNSSKQKENEDINFESIFVKFFNRKSKAFE